MKKFLVLVGVVIGAIWSYNALRPARIMNAWLRASGATAASIEIGWSYSTGQRPVSLVLDVAAPGGIGGSLTTDGEEHSGRIALAAPFSGPYTITSSAVYRVLGRAHRELRVFGGTI
jgi:hypothetical protein